MRVGQLVALLTVSLTLKSSLQLPYTTTINEADDSSVLGNHEIANQLGQSYTVHQIKSSKTDLTPIALTRRSQSPPVSPRSHHTMTQVQGHCPHLNPVCLTVYGSSRKLQDGTRVQAVQQQQNSNANERCRGRTVKCLP